MKKRIGLSIYPEQSTFDKDKEYLDLGKKYGYSVVFTSILHFVKDKDAAEKAAKVLKSLKYAKELGYYTILDVESESMKLINLDNTLSKCKEYGVDCIRLDSPLRAPEIAFITHNKANVDIQINMSNNDTLIDNIFDYGPIRSRLNGCHNFYPLKYTALSYDFFEKCNDKFLRNRLETSAFVGSHFGEMTTAVGWKELPTLEIQRFLNIKTQAKILFYSDQIDNVLIGNAYATENELKELSELDRYRITFDIDKVDKLTNEEKEIILSDCHFRRGDLTEYFIRSTMPRIYFKDFNLPENNIKKTFNKGDIVIINKNDPKYKGELHIILKDNFENENNKYNFVGVIKEEEMKLMDLLNSNTHFSFEIK
ncbi:MupG family TIM beta-alpha barrel fold protein [Mesoplasma florum]|uniref:MupG family TIM beta-alpha barrel fold protein n=1 Tax=Mesoplasma florum TaxID=2151 RepID=UPI000D02DDE7|nr:MupG family TIM beta-alpha barrel fold protein [Mesoplasma florum]AVN58907.1 hypothetical protein CG009_01540 [Mesoplasma florum]